MRYQQLYPSSSLSPYTSALTITELRFRLDREVGRAFSGMISDVSISLSTTTASVLDLSDLDANLGQDLVMVFPRGSLMLSATGGSTGGGPTGPDPGDSPSSPSGPSDGSGGETGGINPPPGPSTGGDDGSSPSPGGDTTPPGGTPSSGSGTDSPEPGPGTDPMVGPGGEPSGDPGPDPTPGDQPGTGGSPTDGGSSPLGPAHGFEIAVILAEAFTYDPAVSHLLMEVRNYSGELLFAGPNAFDAHAHLPSAWVAGSASGNVASGSRDGGLVTQLVTSPLVGPTASVPEPSWSLSLCVMVLIGITRRRRS